MSGPDGSQPANAGRSSPPTAKDGGSAANAGRNSPRDKLPRGVWALGFVSLSMDTSSEMIHALLPVFLVSVLGAGAMTVGVIEGVGEATASITKLFSGWLSDRLGRRKALAVAGYALAAASKPLFAVAPTTLWVLLARFSDRVGKGVRGAPRDALVGDLTPPDLRGAAFGLRQSLDTVGAFLGPLLGIALMAASGDDFRLVFWIAVLPALASVSILVFGVREHRRPEPQTGKRLPLRWRELAPLGAFFWLVVGVAAVLTLGRFSEAFLILRARNLGLSLALAPLVLILMNVVYAISAYPMGALSDRNGRGKILAAGFAVLLLADAVLALAPDLAWAALGVALWGLHMGMTQGLLSALVADAVPARLRGTAFGLFNLATGVALLAASLMAGALWQWRGPPATFLGGGVFTLLGVGGLALIGWRRASA
jgi:MFS family permease